MNASIRSSTVHSENLSLIKCFIQSSRTYDPFYQKFLFGLIQMVDLGEEVAPVSQGYGTFSSNPIQI